MKRIHELTEVEQNVFNDIMDNDGITKKDLAEYILESVHVGKDDLDSVVNSIIC